MNKTAVALGFFDGVHQGHEIIINRITSENLIPVVCTFDRHPLSVLGRNVPLIFTNERKKEVLLSLGVSDVIFEHTDMDFLGMSPESFVKDVLVTHLNSGFIAVGEDYTFGRGGAGNAEFLRAECAKYGIAVEIVPFLKKDDMKISSSILRELILKGDFKTANSLMTAQYEISGEVIHGRKDGRKFGFPTANVIPPEEIILPPNGVYFTETEIDGKIYASVTNLGLAPTCGNNAKICETNILAFDGDLYGKTIKTRFLHFKRAETKFNSTDELIASIANDKAERERYGTDR